MFSALSKHPGHSLPHGTSGGKCSRAVGSSDLCGALGSKRAVQPCSQSPSKAVSVTMILACRKGKSSEFLLHLWGGEREKGRKGSCTCPFHIHLLWCCHITALHHKCRTYSLVSKKKAKKLISLHGIFVHFCVSGWLWPYHHTGKTTRPWTEPGREKKECEHKS